jgi:hypothetical protein
MSKLADKVTGWQLVVLIGLFLATIVTLVAMGQQLSALVAAGLTIAVALGANVVQVAANQAGQGQKMDQLQKQSNGNTEALMREVTRARDELAQARHQAIALAALVPPDRALMVPQIMMGGDMGGNVGGGSGDPEAPVTD